MKRALSVIWQALRAILRSTNLLRSARKGLNKSAHQVGELDNATLLGDYTLIKVGVDDFLDTKQVSALRSEMGEMVEDCRFQGLKAAGTNTAINETFGLAPLELGLHKRLKAKHIECLTLFADALREIDVKINDENEFMTSAGRKLQISKLTLAYNTRIRELEKEIEKYNAILNEIGHILTDHQQQHYNDRIPIKKSLFLRNGVYAVSLAAIAVSDLPLNLQAAYDALNGSDVTKYALAVGMTTMTVWAMHMVGSALPSVKSHKLQMGIGSAIGLVLFGVICTLRIANAGTGLDNILLLVGASAMIIGILVGYLRARHHKFWELKDQINEAHQCIADLEGKIKEAADIHTARIDLIETVRVEVAQKNLRILTATRDDIEARQREAIEFVSHTWDNACCQYRLGYITQRNSNGTSIAPAWESSPPAFTEIK